MIDVYDERDRLLLKIFQRLSVAAESDACLGSILHGGKTRNQSRYKLQNFSN